MKMMIKKETIKNFLKPTKIKIGLMVLIFIGTLFLVADKFPLAQELETLSLSKKVFYFFSIPDLYLQQICLYKIYNICFHKIFALSLFGPSSDPEDIEIVSWLFFLFPLRIIYYYLLSCAIVSISKIKREKKINLP